MTYRGPMARSVGSSLASIAVAKSDEGAAALARRYAALIDDAQPTAIYARHLTSLREALDVLIDIDPATAKEYNKLYEKLSEALSAHSVMSDLGPKLLAALAALGMTAASRGAVVKGGGNSGSPATPKPETELERLRRERAERAGLSNA